MNVSVVVPAYNAERTLGHTIDSLLQQTCQTWEAVIVDDGSTDGTAALARARAEVDARIRVISQSNGGESAARNSGIREARYPWLLFLDADDWIAPDHLERMTAVLEADPTLDAVHCRSVRVAIDGTQISDNYDPPIGDLFPTLALRAAFPVHACVVRRSLVEAVGLFDTTLKTSPDWDLWQRVARAGARFGAIREVLAYYRMQPASASLDAEQLFRDGMRVLRGGHAADPRVANPRPEHAQGAPPGEVDSQQFYLLCWCAGLLIGQNRSALPLLDVIPDGRCRTLYADAIAQCIFEATTLPRCVTTAAWETLWPITQPLVHEFLPALERHSGTEGLAPAALDELKLCILRRSPSWGDVVRRMEAREQRRTTELQASVEALHSNVDALEREKSTLEREKSTLEREKSTLASRLEASDLENARLHHDLSALEHNRWVRLGRSIRIVHPPPRRPGTDSHE